MVSGVVVVNLTVVDLGVNRRFVVADGVSAGTSAVVVANVRRTKGVLIFLVVTIRVDVEAEVVVMGRRVVEALVVVVGAIMVLKSSRLFLGMSKTSMISSDSSMEFN